MASRSKDQEITLVGACVSGDQRSWNEFYNKYVCLVRSVVRRKLRIPGDQVEDVVQNVFGDLVPALKKYDATVSLTRFIVVISERVCINEYHRKAAAKRAGETMPIDGHDTGDEGAWRPVSNCPSPAELLEQEQLKEILRKALWELSAECWKILTLREFEGLPWKEISEMLGQKEGSLTVKGKRCLEELKAICHTLIRRGCAS